jgi:putative ABC transport system substrate-binding protein
VGNPVGSGYVASMSRPGANVTGFSAFEPEITGKWMQVLQETAPATRHVTFLTYPGYEFLWHGAEAAAAALGLAVSQATAHNPAEIERAISSTASRPGGALIVMPAPVFATNRELIARLAASHKLPALYPFRYYAVIGGLISYGMDAVDIFRRASLYVDRILKGENPGDLPIQAPTKFELVINLKTAKALGLTVPVTLLARADEVIE